MQAILITFDQAYYERIVDMLERMNCRGFTAWKEVQGRGSVNGEPHFGSHAWPSLASAIITMVEDSRVDAVLDKLHAWDVETPRLGLPRIRLARRPHYLMTDAPARPMLNNKAVD